MIQIWSDQHKVKWIISNFSFCTLKSDIFIMQINEHKIEGISHIQQMSI